MTVGLLVSFIVLSVLSGQFKDVVKTNQQNVDAYRAFVGRLDMAINRQGGMVERQEEMLERLRKMEADLARTRESVDRLTERYAPKPGEQ